MIEDRQTCLWLYSRYGRSSRSSIPTSVRLLSRRAIANLLQQLWDVYFDLNGAPRRRLISQRLCSFVRPGYTPAPTTAATTTQCPGESALELIAQINCCLSALLLFRHARLRQRLFLNFARVLENPIGLKYREWRLSRQLGSTPRGEVKNLSLTVRSSFGRKFHREKKASQDYKKIMSTSISPRH